MFVFTSEAVSEGHPDKVADQISDAILDAVLSLDPGAHVAAESFVGPDFAANLGEILLRPGVSAPDPEPIVRAVVRDIGYDRPDEKFSFNTLKYDNRLSAQSPDIAMGVDRGAPEEQGAGDQGMMFGYASRETPELMPAPISLAHRLIRRFTDERKSGRIPWLRPDAKSQVSVVYDGTRPVAIDAVVLSHQTTDEPDIERDIRPTVEAVVRDELADTGLVTNATKFHVNPTGRFVVGGPAGDSGLTGRKIVVDTYGGACPHGGGAFSGKDPSKVDRSAAYYARYAAKNFVAAGWADVCEIQVSYAIGVAAPTSYRVRFFGTEKGGATEEKAVALLRSGELFDFRPGKLIAALGLLSPKGWRYRDTASGGHFGRPAFPWEATDKAAALAAAL